MTTEYFPLGLAFGVVVLGMAGAALIIFIVRLLAYLRRFKSTRSNAAQSVSRRLFAVRFYRPFPCT